VDIERVKDRIRKLLATAADDAATEGEIDNAVRFARQPSDQYAAVDAAEKNYPPRP
jgi:hypothetical protein